MQHSSSSSSQTPSSSPSPTPVPTNRNSKQHYQRPSTLHGLKHKLHTSGCSKTLHTSSPSCPTTVPNRRKSVGHIPLSPLARTPSPSPLPASPTRSPSPLAFPVGHQPGSSNTTQSYSPSAGTAPVPANNQTKKGFVRPKNAEPGSPLLRRALSPDRLHPRSAESKCSLISPLCSSGNTSVVKSQNRPGTSAVWRPNNQQEREKEDDINTIENNTSTNENRLSLNLSGPGELLPRIAEEKDSPTNGQEKEKDKEKFKDEQSDKTKDENSKEDTSSKLKDDKDKSKDSSGKNDNVNKFECNSKIDNKNDKKQKSVKK